MFHTSQAALHDVFENKACAHILKLFEIYLNYPRRENGRFSTFSVSYIDLEEVLLGLLRTSKEGNWMLHLASNFVP